MFKMSISSIKATSNATSNNGMLWLIVIALIILAVVGIPMMIKKKKQNHIKQMISSRHNKDEV